MYKKFKIALLVLGILLCFELAPALYGNDFSAYALPLNKNTKIESSIIDPLPSWNDRPTKKAILDFVQLCTDKSNPKYVPPEKRIATFDQDGTLWVEQPMYTQVIFAFDRVKLLAPEHPEWKEQQPFKAILTGDKTAIGKFNQQDMEQIVLATHSGLTTEAFHTAVHDWIQKSKNSRWNQPYTALVYQPMLELLNYLRANGFKTYIVTGGGQDFVRDYGQQVYGIPPEQVIGSALKTQYAFDKKGNPALIITPHPLLNNNFSGKPEDIYLFIGRRPVAAFGNSTGDQQMLEYTQGSNGAHLMMLIYHDDASREYAYGSKSKIGTFSEELMREANQKGWIVVSMKNDWKRIFPFDN